MTEPVVTKVREQVQETQTHDTRIVVWETPAPAVASRPTRVHVGVQCAAGCSLAGHAVEIRDPNGASIGNAVLGNVPVDGTSDLYWAEVIFDAPAEAGLASQIAAFRPSNTEELAHVDSTALFTFHTDPPPQHCVTVTILWPETGAPVVGAEVRLDRYVRTSDERGEACFDVPAGTYTCNVRKWGVEVEGVDVAVACDMVIQLEARAGMTREEYDDWVSKYEDHPWG